LVTVLSRNHGHERGSLPSMGEKHLPQAFCLKEACKKKGKRKKEWRSDLPKFHGRKPSSTH
jgi:hypothetical protein